eukprot:gene23833-16213_t
MPCVELAEIVAQPRSPRAPGRAAPAALPAAAPRRLTPPAAAPSTGGLMMHSTQL